MRKLKFRKAKQLFQGYANNKLQRQNLDLGFQVFYFPKAPSEDLESKQHGCRLSSDLGT